MFRRLIVCGAFVWLSMSGPLLAKPNFGTSEIEQPVPEAVSRLALPSANVRPKSAPPSTEMLEMIANWITSRFGLPQSNALPRVALMSPTDIAALRSGDLALEGLHSITIINANLANLERAVVSVYEKATKTIFLPEGWSGETPAEVSILVHEFVHHLQNEAGYSYECPAASEKLAYEAQQQWLNQFGLDLEHEFELDEFTIHVSSLCGY